MDYGYIYIYNMWLYELSEWLSYIYNKHIVVHEGFFSGFGVEFVMTLPKQQIWWTYIVKLLDIILYIIQ